MKWCCLGFQGNSQMAGERGFGIFAVQKSNSEAEFLLQHRAMDPGSTAPYTDTPLSLVFDLQIRFCPWCGVSLRRQYRGDVGELERPELRVPL